MSRPPDSATSRGSVRHDAIPPDPVRSHGVLPHDAIPPDLPRPQRMARILERDGGLCAWCSRPLRSGTAT